MIALDQAPDLIPRVRLQVVTLQELHGKVRHEILVLTFPPACGCQASASWTVGSAEVAKNQIETQKLLAPLMGLLVERKRERDRQRERERERERDGEREGRWGLGKST